jgi:hypothetical protein
MVILVSPVLSIGAAFLMIVVIREKASPALPQTCTDHSAVCEKLVEIKHSSLPSYAAFSFRPSSLTTLGLSQFALLQLGQTRGSSFRRGCQPASTIIRRFYAETRIMTNANCPCNVFMCEMKKDVGARAESMRFFPEAIPLTR